MPRARLLPPLLLVAACGGGASFEGTYVGVHLAMPVTVTLEQEGDAVTGRVSIQERTLRLEGRVDGDVVRGTGTGDLRAKTITFEARLTGEGIAWSMASPRPLGGGEDRIRVDLRRRQDAWPRDPRLVGFWRRAGSGGVGAVHSVAPCGLDADGTYAYGEDGVCPKELAGVPGLLGPGAAIKGQWKAEDGVLWARGSEREGWRRVGPYDLSGSTLLVDPGTGRETWLR